MHDKSTYENVWDAIEEDPVRAENLKLRSHLMLQISESIRERGLTQVQAAKVLEVSQPRVSALLRGHLEEFRLDTLVDMLHRLGLRVSIEVAA